MSGSTWDRFLDLNYCTKDNVGNRPCDSGKLCDACATPNAWELYQEVLKKETIKKGGERQLKDY